MNSEDNIRYVAAGNPTGWAAMAKTVNEVDEGKVKNYKEDIDTLLVFTGLFSAVITAFLIVSYVSLSPDKQDTVIQILAQIANQTNSYNVAATIINSTSPPTPLSQPSFTPPLAALRVNYLFFASLILTLVTASFSMLVKQWLREFLAYDYTSPHERLRARQFRYPGLHTWKVFEIAAVLPLLLQLSLGLFFLGLCFFTRSDLHGIGDMCAVLVALWASFFVTATIAPLFSPQCPYKTALLKAIMVPLRRSFRPLLRPFIEEEEAIKQETDELSILNKVDAFLLDDDLLGTTIFDALTQHHASPSHIITFVLQALALRLKGRVFSSPLMRPPNLRRLSIRGWIAVSDIVAATILNHLPPDMEKPDPADAEQFEIRSWVQDATYLLLSSSEQPFTPSARLASIRLIQGAPLPDFTKALREIDTSLNVTGRFDDFLHSISTHLLQLLGQKKTKIEDIVDFVIAFLRAEVRPTHPTSLLPCGMSPLDMQSLSKKSCDFTADVLGAVINDYRLSRGSEETKLNFWVKDTIYILLSISSHSTPSSRNPTGNKALVQLCKDDLSTASAAILQFGREARLAEITHACGTLIASSKTANCFDALLDDVSVHLDALLSQGTSKSTEVFSLVFSFIAAECRIRPFLPLKSNLDLQRLSKRTWQFSSDILGTMIVSTLGPSYEETDIGTWLEDGICVLLSGSSSPLTSIGNAALTQLCLDDRAYTKLGDCIERLASPHHAYSRHTLARLHEVCKNLNDDASALWLLESILLSVPCSEQRRHELPPESGLGPLLAVRADYNFQWTGNFMTILGERITRIPAVQGIWPAGSAQSLFAFMSLPISDHPVYREIQTVVFSIICDIRKSASALRPLVSVDLSWHSQIAPDAAVACVSSLFRRADQEGRRKFIHAMWDACNDYLSDETKARYEQIGEINIVRHANLVSMIHESDIASDQALFPDWLQYYTACAQAMVVFRKTQYLQLPDTEQAPTIQIATECLKRLQTMEISTNKLYPLEKQFSARNSLYSPAIFDELVEFVTNTDAVAYKHIRPGMMSTIPRTAMLKGNGESAGNRTGDETGGNY